MSTPTGWYPDPDDPTQRRYWDGSGWTDFRVPAPPGAAQQDASPAPPAPPAPPRRVPRIAIIGIALALAVVGLAVVAVVVRDGVSGFFERGGTVEAQPTEITVEVGDPFEFGELTYAPGWSIRDNRAGLFTVTGLEATNTGDLPAFGQTTFSLLRGRKVVAEVTCTTTVKPGRTATPGCSSFDAFPRRFDTVTVRDGR